MAEWPGGCVVFLDQGVGGAGHLKRRVGGDGADQGAGEHGLAGAERAVEQDCVARADDGGDAGAEGLGCFRVGEAKAEGCCGVEHGRMLTGVDARDQMVVTRTGGAACTGGKRR